MKTRIITAICMAVVLVPVAIFSGTLLYPVVMALMSAVGSFEMLRCIGLHKTYTAAVPCIAISALVPFAAYLIPNKTVLLLASITAVMMFLFFTVSLFSHGKIPIDQAAMAFLGLTYIIWGFGFMTLLRQVKGGVYLYLLPFLGAWVSDSFAYFTGRLIGRHKLIPDVSPKKTVEGAIGGILFAMLSFVLYGWIVSLSADVTPNYFALFMLGLPISVVSIIGDLIMSLIKRRYNVKDYGNLLPGHGGILDRFDSVLATAIALYLLCANAEFFNMIV